MFQFLKNFNEDDLYEPFHKELTNLFTKKVDRYYPSLTFLTIKQKKKFEKYCRSNIIHKSYRLNVTYRNIYDSIKFPYLIYLSKKKAEENIEAINKRKKIHTIVFSGSHFNKVCRATIEKNYRFEIVLSDIKLYENEIKPKNYSIIMKNFKWDNRTKKQDEKEVNITDKDVLRKDIYDIPITKRLPKKIITPKEQILKSPPKISSSSKSEFSIIDNIINNKENKKKLEKSLKIIKSLIK